MHEDEGRVAAGYDAVYRALPASPTFQRVWRRHAIGDGYPADYEHISVLTAPELRAMKDDLRLGPATTLVDLACGMGGPGLWVARETGARLVGIDISDVAITSAADRAASLGLSGVARFAHGSFAHTGLEPASVDGIMTVDALQYARGKIEALREVARILRPGGRFVFACFEVEPARVAGLPVLGADPVADYHEPLHQAGFDVPRYDESIGWRERLTAAYGAVLDARRQLTAEMGEPAVLALVAEMTLTLQANPYRRRVLVSAIRR